MRVTALVRLDSGTEYGDEIPVANAVRELLASKCVDEVLLAAGDEPRFATLGNAADLLVVHEPGRTSASAEVIRSIVTTVRSGEAEAAVAALPVTDTIKIVEPGGVLRGTWERHRLREIQSPICCRMGFATALGSVPALRDLPPERVRLVAGDAHTPTS